MLLAKHSQLQPVNCLISHQSISPNKERYRAVKTQWRVRVNERAGKDREQAKAGLRFFAELQATGLFGVSTNISYLTQKGRLSDRLLIRSHIELYYFAVLIAGCSHTFCVYVCESQLNGNILKIRTIWGF